jgi:hypothetical protein
MIASFNLSHSNILLFGQNYRMAQFFSSFKPGGKFVIKISTDNVEIVPILCKTIIALAALHAGGTVAITLGALYVGYKLVRPLVNAAVKKALGGERDDQEVRDIREGSLLVELHCFTDERFLEVLNDYDSGDMKKRFEEELSQAGFKVEGLEVEIKNSAEVKETEEAINKRYHGCIMKHCRAHGLCHNFNKTFYLFCRYGNCIFKTELM